MSTMHTWYQKHKCCTGPLGVPCREEDAHELEALVKEAEHNGGGYTKHFFASEMETKAASDDGPRHTLLLTASTEDLDRDNEVVDMGGLNLKFYNRNPVIAYNHDHSMPPIGRALWAKVQDRKLKALAKLADRPADWPPIEWFPDTVFALAEQGILKGVSVGMLTLDASPPTEKEIKARPDLASARRILRKNMLVEISIVSIGANQSALVQSVKKGLVPSEAYKHLGLEEPCEAADLWQWSTEDYLPPQEQEVVKVVQAEPVAKKLTRQDVLKKIAARLNR